MSALFTFLGSAFVLLGMVAMVAFFLHETYLMVRSAVNERDWGGLVFLGTVGALFSGFLFFLLGQITSVK